MQGQFWKNFRGLRRGGAGPIRAEGRAMPAGAAAHARSVRRPTWRAEHDPPLLYASELCQFTTINQECSTTHAFSHNRRALYLLFCKRRTRGARESPIRRSKPAWF